MKKLKILFITALALMFCGNIFAQTNVTGKVVDDSGAGMPGVTVVVKGTTTGTVTDLDGQYSLNVNDPENAILEFSYIGYKPQESAVSGRTAIDITLKENVEELEEVVVIGYGVTKKSDLTASISSVTAEELSSKPVSTVEEVLQGRAAGVHVNQSSGRPGDAPTITIRGVGSIQASTKPLWIIDGIITDDPSRLSPSDIERMEVLKDAASTAIYGARGGNGVILVTTKSGKAGKSIINVDYNHQIRNRTRKIDLLSGQELMTMQNLALVNAGRPPRWSDAEINGTAPLMGGDYYVSDTDWQDIVGQTGIAQNLTVSASGGSDKTTFFLSGTYQDETGIIKGTGYKKATARLNIDHSLSDKLKVGANISGYNTLTNKTNVGGAEHSPGPAGAALQYPAYFPVRDTATGEYFDDFKIDNPLEQAENHLDDIVNTGAQGKVYLNYNILPSLRLELSADGDYTHFLNRKFIPSTLEKLNATGNAKAEIENRDFFNWTTRAILRYTKEFGIHSIQAMGGYEEQYGEILESKIRAEKISKDSYKYWNLSGFDQELTNISSYNDQSASRSVFARVEYKLMDKYVVTGIVRQDGSSKFGPDNKYGIFPSTSIAWKAHEESFIKALNIFDELKVRANYGIVGSDRIGTYRWLPNIRYGNLGNGGNANLDGQVLLGAGLVDVYNPAIKWERGKQVDVGLDFAFFKKRLQINLDYYNRNTDNLLVNVNLPYYVGFGDNWSNLPDFTANRAKMHNHGYEAAITGDIISAKDFNWEVSFTYSTNINKVVDVPTKDGTLSTSQGYLREGFPVGEMTAYITDGLYQTVEETINSPYFTGIGNAEPGDVKYVDANGDNDITSADRGVVGNYIPKHLFNLSTGIRYKFIELNVLAHSAYKVNRINYNMYNYLMSQDLGEYNGSKELLRAWTPENPNTDVPRMIAGATKVLSDRFVEDASYIKISNIQLAVNVPDDFAKKYMRLKSLKVYASMQNWFIFTKYSGYDPELRNNSGEDKSSYPPYKALTLGINVGL